MFSGQFALLHIETKLKEIESQAQSFLGRFIHRQVFVFSTPKPGFHSLLTDESGQRMALRRSFSSADRSRLLARKLPESTRATSPEKSTT